MKRTGIVENIRKTSIGSNHKGFSLIEVLIAMIILVIAAIPIYRSFVLTARINADSKQQSQTKMVAENIIEGLRPYSAEDLKNKFDMEKTPKDQFNIINGFDASNGEYGLIESIENENEKKDVYYVTGIKQNVTDNHASVYDARITIDKSNNLNNYTYQTVANYVSGKDYMGALDHFLDDKYYGNIVTYLNSNPDVKERMINLVEDNRYYPRAVNFNDPAQLLQFVKENTTRIIRININYISSETGEADSELTSGRKVLVAPVIDYQLSIAMSNNTSDDVLIYKVPGTVRPEVFFVNANESYPRNIFFRYLPNYNSTIESKTVNRRGDYSEIGNINPKDIIEIENPGGIDTTVILVKTFEGNATLTANDEKNYKVAIRVYDNDKDGNKTHTVIRTNINESLADSSTKLNQLVHIQARAYSKKANTTGSMEAQISYGLSPVSESTKTFLYQIQVEVFRHGDNMNEAEPISILSNVE